MCGGNDKRAFDTKCHDLATYFTEDAPAGRWTPEDVNDLAQLIQEAIEDFLNERGGE